MSDESLSEWMNEIQRKTKIQRPKRNLNCILEKTWEIQYTSKKNPESFIDQNFTKSKIQNPRFIQILRRIALKFVPIDGHEIVG